jgi:hypothetical protein
MRGYNKKFLVLCSCLLVGTSFANNGDVAISVDPILSIVGDACHSTCDKHVGTSAKFLGSFLDTVEHESFNSSIENIRTVSKGLRTASYLTDYDVSNQNLLSRHWKKAIALRAVAALANWYANDKHKDDKRWGISKLIAAWSRAGADLCNKNTAVSLCSILAAGADTAALAEKYNLIDFKASEEMNDQVEQTTEDTCCKDEPCCQHEQKSLEVHTSPCMVCNQESQNHIQLECGHSSCWSCLERSAQGGEPACSICSSQEAENNDIVDEAPVESSVQEQNVEQSNTEQDDDDDRCPVCFESFRKLQEQGVEIVTLDCKHRGCKKCITAWANARPSEFHESADEDVEHTCCPVCRKDVLGKFR